jgi:hypothetical protein
MRAFSGHFPPTQLLYLWDLIIAYDSLELLPLLAASILSFRKERGGLNLFLKLQYLFNSTCHYTEEKIVVASTSILHVRTCVQSSNPSNTYHAC